MSLRQELLREKRVREFISISKLEELVTVSSVKEYLSSYFGEPTTPIPPDLPQRIVPRARKLFAVLVLSELEGSISEFVIEHGVTDHVFPVSDSDAIPPLGSREERRKFLKEQWTIPPILKEGEHLELPLGTILPFLEMKYIEHGSFGAVYKVRVAEGHLERASLGYTAGSNFALKMIKVEEGKLDIIKREIATLRNRVHPNIVPLLASYTKYANESSCETKFVGMLFPLAEMNMEKWLCLHQTPSFLACKSRVEQRRYLYAAMSDLASALATLHREVGGLVTSHHDIKPQNILVINEKLVIADLGKSEFVHLGRVAGSEVDGKKGLGTKTYQPPEYYGKDGKKRNEGNMFGRAFDMWAMGCIMIQVAILIVWGWESGEIERFRKEREEFVSQQTNHGALDDSEKNDNFFKSIPVVDVWLARLQEDGSANLQGFLAVAVQMLRENPLERIYSWEAALDLHELLHPDEPVKTQFEDTANLVQSPPPVKDINGFETPVHRASERGNIIRAINLLEMGWPVEPRDGMGFSPIELAERNRHLQLKDILLQATTIKQSGWKSVLHGKIPTSVIHIRDSNGFRLKPEAAQRGLGAPPVLREDPDLSKPLTNSGRQNPLTSKKEHKYRRTELHEAAQHGDVVTLKTLLRSDLEEGAVLQTDEFGQTPLHYAAETSQIAASTILKSVTDAKPLLFAENQIGRTPLHAAAEAGNIQAVETLLEFCKDNADKRRLLLQEDSEGVTAVKLARAKGHHIVTGILNERLRSRK